MLQPFQSNQNLVYAITVASTASTPIQPANPSGNVGDWVSYLITNMGSTPVYICGRSVATAATIPVPGTPGNGIPIDSYGQTVLSYPYDSWFSVICPSGQTSTVLITAGEGL